MNTTNFRGDYPIASLLIGGIVSWGVGEIPGRTQLVSEAEVDARLEAFKDEFEASLTSAQSDIVQLERQLDLLRNTNDALKLDERFDALERALSGIQE